MSFKDFITLASEVYGRKLEYHVIPKFILKIGAVFSKRLSELQELLPRYAHDNIFDVSKFKKRFPEFRITTFREGIEQIKAEQETVRQEPNLG
ncbi:Rossmann-fold NAD(P)-binding domain-containing protein [Pedobacter nyackensis]|uniref:Uncharacterized protein n=1 Tax=Pedobacter nyackensis TaxID=475255 RepID=A0A1W2F9Z7_9SPHI|nr:hypothetical protein [Pedobacter nyackensis]SMD18542.1 hypothetical protein SAMN04488101_12714 [Pedobacter nyackensis]